MKVRYMTSVKELSVPPCDMADIESCNFDCGKASYLHMLSQQDIIEADYCST